MARAYWKGAISFGLVNIPIALSAATRSQDVHFHMLHEKDGGRIREKRFCEIDGKEVPYEQIVKGYELTKNNYVTLTKEELKNIDATSDRTIAIEAFVKLQEIDPVYFERSYFAVPEGRGSDKAYALLVAAMENSGRVAIGRIVLSTKQHMCMIRLASGVLQVTTLAYGNEVLAAPKVSKSATTKREVEMAGALIEQLAAPFSPKDMKDEHAARVQKLIEQKSKGKEILAPQETEPQTMSSLAEALERSLGAKKKPATAARAQPRTERAAKKPVRARKAHPAKRRAPGH